MRDAVLIFLLVFSMSLALVSGVLLMFNIKLVWTQAQRVIQRLYGQPN